MGFTSEDKGRTKRVAIVHDWLVDYAGSERVLEQICSLYPDADLFTLVDHMAPALRARIGSRASRVSFLQRMPWVAKKLHWYLPIMPLAIQQFDLSDYDVVISSSHCVAKGVITNPDAAHLCYCHSPMRYAWDMQPEYLRTEGLERGPRSWLARILLFLLRIWDVTSAGGVDAFAANSRFVARRIAKFYRRASVVIHPPVDVREEQPPTAGVARSHYVTVGRLIGYKNVDVIIEAFRKLPDRTLIVIGDGPHAESLKKIAPSNVIFEGAVDEDRKQKALSAARAFIFAATEDFGIAPVEALAHGTPVIAFIGGGIHDYVAHGENGWLVDVRDAEALAEGILAAERALPSDCAFTCWNSVQSMSQSRFRTEIAAWVDRVLAEKQGNT